MMVHGSRLVIFSLVWFLLCHYPSPCQSAHPTNTNTNKDHEEAKRYHRRLKEGRSTLLVDPALCNGTPDEKCRRLDVDMLRSGKRLRGITQKKGFIRILVLLMQFTDHASRILPPESAIQELFNGQHFSDIIPTGSVSQYIQYNSYNKLTVEAHVVPWTMTDNTEHHYADGRSGLIYEFHRSFYPLLNKLESQGFNFSHFDQDGDGNIDSLVVLHSGYPAEVGGRDCTNNRKHEHRVWAHALAADENNWRSRKTGKRVFGYCVASALRGVCDADPARISVITHEYLHMFGLPDLDDGRDYIGRGVGDYDIMGNSHGKDGSQTMPSHLSPWSKIKLGWVEPKEIQLDGDYSIRASEAVGDIYKISKNFPSGEYLLIENRQPLLWDQLLDKGGILVWHIDDVTDSNKRRGDPWDEGWPGNGDHYQVALLAADGMYDLEVGRNSGDDGDYWKNGGVLGPGPIEYDATEVGIHPNTNAYQFGYIRRTGVTLYNFSSSKFEMQFSVKGVSTADTLSPVSAPTPFIQSISTLGSASVSTTPTYIPSAALSNEPSELPSMFRSPIRSIFLIEAPSASPSNVSSQNPSNVPLTGPTQTPSLVPTIYSFPSASPTRLPSSVHSTFPTTHLSTQPSTLNPSIVPSAVVTGSPSLTHSDLPTFDPSSYDSVAPSSQPTQSLWPSQSPTLLPSFNPSDSTVKSTEPSVLSDASAASFIPSATSTSVFNIVAGYHTLYGLNQITRRTHAPQLSPVPDSEEPSNTPSQNPPYSLFSEPIALVADSNPSSLISSPRPSDVGSRSPSSPVQHNIFSRPTSQPSYSHSPSTAPSQTSMPSRTSIPTSLDLKNCLDIMSFADQNGNYQISRTEYPRFINSLSAFGSDLSFENLPFVLKESFEHLQKGGQLQRDDAQEICDKTRTAIQLATLLSGLA